MQFEGLKIDYENDLRSLMLESMHRLEISLIVIV